MNSVSLGDVATWGSGGTPSRSVHEYFGAGIPWLSIADLNDGPVGSAKESLTLLGLKNSSAKMVPSGTLLVAMYGSIGKLGIATRDLCTSQAIAFAIPDKSRVDTRYMFHFLLAQRPYLQAMGRGGTQSNIGQGDLKSWQMPLPPLPKQRRIADILDKADALRAKRRAALAKLDELIQSIFLDMFGDPATNPKGWGVVTLGDVGDVQGGLQLSAKRKSAPREIPYLRVANVYRCALNLDEIKTLSATEAEIARTSLVKDDFLMVEGHGNPDEIGRGALWDGSITHCVHQNHLIRVRFNATHVVPAYAAAYLNSQGGRRHLLRSGKTTSGLNTINVSQVRATPLALPPIELQRSYEHRVRGVERLRGFCTSASDGAAMLFASLQHRAFRGEL